MKKPVLRILVILFCIVASSVNASAQFRAEAFKQNYNDNAAAATDTTGQIFSFKEYFGGLSHKREARVGTLFAGSAVLVGGYQIYNKDYWKLPIIYGGIAAGITGGIISGKQGKQLQSTCFYVGAGLMYWGALLDGVISYKPNDYPQPGKATLYSILVPGLGQAYNGEYWKIPIYTGIMIGGIHFWIDNSRNFQRFRNICIEISENPEYKGPYTYENAKYYRDEYRKMRDYSILVTFGGYLLQIIDANVFAYMHNFNVSDDLSMSIGPTVIQPDLQYACSPAAAPGIGMGLSFKF